MTEERLWLPPTMRFVVELTTWIWLVAYNFILLFVSLLALSRLNYPGDKKAPEHKGLEFYVPGYLRILVEVGSAILGIYAGYEIYSEIGLVFQVAITLYSFYLDYPRWSWMLGRSEVPNFVTYIVDRAKQN